MQNGVFSAFLSHKHTNAEPSVSDDFELGPNMDMGKFVDGFASGLFCDCDDDYDFETSEGEITDNNKDRNRGLFSFASLIQHSCIPNIHPVSCGTNIIFVAIRPIAADEPLFRSYML